MEEAAGAAARMSAKEANMRVFSMSIEGLGQD
jgi:hypothetical protein